MKKILIIGDIILDREIQCIPERISREAPLPIFKAHKNKNDKYKLGGAGNVLANLIGLGQSLDIWWLKGNDKFANKIQKLLLLKNATNFPIDSNGDSIVKTRFFSEKKQVFRYDIHNKLSDNVKIDMTFLNKIQDSEYDYAILSDYNSNFFTKKRIDKIITNLNKKNIKILIDPHNSDWNIYSNTYLVTPNFQEFSSAINTNISNDSIVIEKEAIKLIKKYNINNILITRSEKGMMLVNKKGTLINVHSQSLDVVDVTGAGDTVVATIASKLNEGKGWTEAIQTSNIAASIVIQKIGVVPIMKSDFSVNNDSILNKINDFNNKIQMNDLKKCMNSKEIVFTNGAFDIIHYGHISYLLESASTNKKLIVGINSDASIKKYKSKDRPINSQQDRALTIAALPFVYKVIIFHEETAINLIKFLNPYIYTKGGDYENKNLPELKYANRIIYIPYKSGFSTSDIISKIKN